nr:hypothetical protein [uncultured Marinifilum sp.]
MNNKKTIYILLPLVLALWGYITYRIFEQVNPEVEISNSVLPPIQNNEKEIKSEAFKLIANYSDPFLKHLEQYNEFNEEEKQNANQNLNNNRIPAWNWPNMSYGGCIKNKNRMVGILQINSKNLLVQEGKSYDDFMVSKMYADSIVMKRDEMKRTVWKNK